MKDILIDVQHSGNKVCVTKDGILEEFWLERRNSEKHVGDVYKGKVMNVLQGMQACFVDIGLEKNAFLYAGDVYIEGKPMSHNGTNAPEKFPLKAGDIIMVQVAKEQFGSKGCRVTMNISLPTHNLVMVPLTDYICASRKIHSEERKLELENIIRKYRPSNYGFIVRTEGENATEDELESDIETLASDWLEIKEKFLRAPVGTRLFNDGGLITRAMRDILRADVDNIIVNDQETLDKIREEFKSICDKIGDNLKLYDKPINMLTYYGIDEQIDSLQEKKVSLSNGAYLVIDRTEALTIIDVNTGKYVGEVNLEETVYITNKIAAREIARQLRLRNIGGIIVIDFIDMRTSQHKDEIMKILAEEFAKDRIKCILIGMTELGMVQITRKKTRSMLDDILLTTCPYCEGNGVVLSEENMVMKIRDYLSEMFSVNPHVTAVKLFVNDKVFAKLFSLRYLEHECATVWADKRIYVIPDSSYHLNKFHCEKLTANIIELPNSAKLLY